MGRVPTIVAAGILFVGSTVSAQPARQGAGAPQDPIAGNWRGSVKSAGGGDSPIIITLVKKGETYVGSTTGLAEGGDVALGRLNVTGNQVSFESAADSRLGSVQIAGELTAEGNAMRGAGTLALGSQKFPVTFELTRRARQDVIQHQVEQRADYFAGRWTFDYTGGEFPPLSAGGRSGSVTFTPAQANFVSGKVDGDVAGKRYQDALTLGVDPESKSVVLHERRSDGVELLSIGSWRSPLAIVFQTSPVQASGKTYQLRRVISILSETSFNITEEFSVDGGAFRRLGNARYTRQ